MKLQGRLSWVAIGLATLSIGFFLGEYASYRGIALSWAGAFAAAFAAVFSLWVLYGNHAARVMGKACVPVFEEDAATFLAFVPLALFGLRGLLNDLPVQRGVDVSALAVASLGELLLIVSAIVFVAWKVKNHPTVFPRGPPARKKALVVVAGAYFVVFFALALMELWSFAVPYPDLSIYEQSVWNTVHGNFMANDITAYNYFGMHFAVVLLLVAPFYALYPHAETLLFFMSAALAFAAVPVYLLARRTFESSGAGLVFAAAFLLHPSTGFLNLHEFHSVVFAIPALLFAFYFLESGRGRAFLVALGFALLAKETVALVGAFMGLYAFFALNRRRLGLTAFALSAAWFLLAAGVAIPAFRGEAYGYFGGTENFYSNFGESAGEVVARMVLDPVYAVSQAVSVQKAGWIALMLAPYAFTALAAPAALLMGLPIWAMNLFSNHSAMANIFFQYNALLLPVLAIAAVKGAKRLEKRFPRRVLLYAVLVSALLANAFYSPSPLNAVDPFPTVASFQVEKYRVNEREQTLRAFIMEIPEGVPVSVNSTLLVSNLANRRSIQPFLQKWEAAEYVLVDSSLDADEGSLERFAALQGSAAFELYREKDGVYLYRRRSPSP